MYSPVRGRLKRDKIGVKTRDFEKKITHGT